MSGKGPIDPDDIIFEEIVEPEDSEVTESPTAVRLPNGTSVELKRLPGRPTKSDKVPSLKEMQYYSLMADAKIQAIEDDPLVRQIQNHGDTAEVLHKVKIEMAKEAAALGYLRNELDKKGRDTGSISSRRADVLAKVADLELDTKKLGVTSVDLKSEKMQRVFTYFIGRMQVVAQKTLTPESIELFFNGLSTDLEGWENDFNDEEAKRNG